MPPEISADSDVADIYEQYEQQIEKFKEVKMAILTKEICQRNSNHYNIYADHAKSFIRLVVRGLLQL